MKLHRLEVTAFGPFGGTEEIAFETLDDAGLFLLTGPTGSGKTSVLDAICFALYGLVPRSEGSKPDVASHYRSPEAVPLVTLEMTVGERRLRVRRSPEYERAKKTGTGTTTESQSVTLERLAEDGEWKIMSSTWSEANTELKEMLGMDLGQFSQVVMLPQGNFAKFLRADVKSRRELLNHLFPSQKMGYVERWLKTRAEADLKSKEAKEKELRSQLDKAAGTLTGLLGDDDHPLADLPDQDDPEAVLAWVDSVTEQLETDRATAAKQEAQARKRLATATAEHERLATRAGLVAERGQLEDRLKALEDRAGEHESMAAAIAEAEKASVVRGLIESFEAREAKLIEVRDEAAGLLAELEADRLVEGTDEAELREQEQALRSTVTILTAFQEDELTRRAGLQERLTAIAGDLETRSRERNEAAERSKSGPADLERLGRELQESKSAESGLEDARKLAAESGRQLQAAKERDGLETALARAGEVMAETKEAADAAATELIHVRNLRTAGMAAGLAAGLEDGQPCVVCGSTEHPSPRQPAEGAPGEQEEQMAESALSAARESYEQARNARDEVKARRDELDARADRRPTADLTAEFERLNAELATREEKAKRSGRLAGEIEELNESIRGATETITATGLEIAKLETERETADQELRNIAERERQLLAGSTTIGERRDRLADLADRVATTLERQADVSNRESAVRTAEAEVLATARSQGFAGVAEARAALVGPDELKAIRTEYAEFENALAVVRERLSAEELAGIDRNEVVPVKAALELVESRTGEHLGAVKVLTSAADRHTAFTELTETVPDLLQELAPLRTAWERSRHLSLLASGKNPRKMELSIYVLAARLKQVIEAANTHLGPMSNDRFQLVYSGDLQGGGATSGLGIQVFDAFTSRTRETKTLSGGESFYASLSLALGLAEIVQQEAGGKTLETLFIDEGFGTLDSDTLDQVMNVIDDLRSDGRTVGLVSHVEELRNRIPAQIRVSGGPDGSRLEVTGV